MIKLERAVIEIFGGCNYTCKMCPQSSPGRDVGFLRKMPLDMFENILDQITPKYGKPVINLEGSGEPTMVKELPLYIEACTKRGLSTLIYSNGQKMRGAFMKDCVDAGLGVFRFSVIGYNREKYKEWMNVDNWELVSENASNMISYTQNKTCEVLSYHLITDNDHVDYELEQYKDNFIDKVGTYGYVWKMHNWSGNYEINGRNITEKRTCGRPFANEITIRAGGLDGLKGAVTPCCQTLGPPNEKNSVLGHFETQTFEEIWNGKLYNDLRQSHQNNDWPSYCEGCDFLYENNDVLVWSNYPKARKGNMIGTNVEVNN